MSTVSYTRPNPANPMNPVALAVQIDAAKVWTGTTCDVNPTAVLVTNAAQGGGQDATVISTINAYVYDPNWWMSSQQKNLQNIIATLRTWATSAHTESAAWNGQSQAQRDSAMTQTFDRLGTFFDRFADLLQTSGWGT